MPRFLRLIIAFAGLNFVIIIHELGHFLACKFFGVDTPVFSVGFGPKIVGIKIGQTLFQIALLPLGGFVSINQAQLDMQPYFHKVIIILAGIFINIFFGILLLSLLGRRHAPTAQFEPTQQSGIIGPIGILNIMEKSIDAGFYFFGRIVAILSINIGIFNLLPIPLLDGGQLLIYTLEALHGPHLSIPIIRLIFIILFLIFFMVLVGPDLIRIRR